VGVNIKIKGGKMRMEKCPRCKKNTLSIVECLWCGYQRGEELDKEVI